VTEWTPDLLKAHFDALRVADTQAVQAALAAAEKAVIVAEVNAKQWRDSANEWRMAMDDRERRFAQKDQVDIATNNLQAQIDDLKKSRDTTGGGNAAAQRYVTAALSALAAVGVIITLIVVIVQHG
jgi:hypothetical protein